MEFKDYYKILGISEDADLKAIKVAYRKLALKFHPDVNPEPDAAEKFREVAEAYEVLKDKNKRAEYDEIKHYGANTSQDFQTPPNWHRNRGAQSYSAQDEADFSDFFNSVFNAASNGEQFRHAQQPYKGQDIEIEVPIFLEDTLSNIPKNIEFMLPDVNGKQVKKSLKVTIPKGVSNGERVRLKGQGVPMSDAKFNGDLYLHIRLVPHPLFDIQGHDLVLVLPIAPWEAVLGTKVEVPTIDGKIKLNIPGV